MSYGQEKEKLAIMLLAPSMAWSLEKHNKCFSLNHIYIGNNIMALGKGKGQFEPHPSWRLHKYISLYGWAVHKEIELSALRVTPSFVTPQVYTRR